eukprot:SAG11_NODE_9365_length_918_cov_5.275946_1_plen_147_part_01
MDERWGGSPHRDADEASEQRAARPWGRTPSEPTQVGQHGEAEGHAAPPQGPAPPAVPPTTARRPSGAGDGAATVRQERDTGDAEQEHRACKEDGGPNAAATERQQKGRRPHASQHRRGRRRSGRACCGGPGTDDAPEDEPSQRTGTD